MSVDKRAFDALAQKVAQQGREIAQLKRAAVVLPTHSIADLPKAQMGGLILVPDATSGSVLAYSDGTDWIKLHPVGVIS